MDAERLSIELVQRSTAARSRLTQGPDGQEGEHATLAPEEADFASRDDAAPLLNDPTP